MCIKIRKLMRLIKKIYVTPQFNNITFEMPQYPFYYQPKNVPKEIVCNDENREPACSKNVSIYCSCVHLYQIKLNDIVEIIFVNGGTKDGLYIFFNIYFYKTSSIYFFYIVPNIFLFRIA